MRAKRWLVLNVFDTPYHFRKLVWSVLLLYMQMHSRMTHVLTRVTFYSVNYETFQKFTIVSWLSSLGQTTTAWTIRCWEDLHSSVNHCAVWYSYDIRHRRASPRDLHASMTYRSGADRQIVNHKYTDMWEAHLNFRPFTGESPVSD